MLVLALMLTSLGCEEDNADDDWVTDDTEIRQPGTDLTWLRCPLGQTWDVSSCIGIRQGMDWETAKANCPAGYRLPDRQEYMVLLGACDEEVSAGRPGSCDSCSDSSDCSSMFGEDEGWYWSSSAGPDGTAYLVGFRAGYVTNHRTDAGFAVRCLR
jgi:hypothetical protein